MSVGEPFARWLPSASRVDAAPDAPRSVPPPPPPPAAVISVTCLHDGRAHAVPDTELTGSSADSGYYQAICGHTVTAAPMVEPDGTPCPSCGAARQDRSRHPARRFGLRLLGGSA